MAHVYLQTLSGLAWQVSLIHTAPLWECGVAQLRVKGNNGGQLDVQSTRQFPHQHAIQLGATAWE